MSFVTDVQCPNCGKVRQIYLGGYGFYGKAKTIVCYKCGISYDGLSNCLSMEVERGEDFPVDTQSIRFSQFSTKELEEELKRRKG